MVMTDPIADFLTHIRNANSVGHKTVSAPSSKIKVAIAEILKQEGFIKNYEVAEDDKQGEITIFLKYGLQYYKFFEIRFEFEKFLN